MFIYRDTQKQQLFIVIFRKTLEIHCRKGRKSYFNSISLFLFQVVSETTTNKIKFKMINWIAKKYSVSSLPQIWNLHSGSIIALSACSPKQDGKVRKISNRFFWHHNILLPSTKNIVDKVDLPTSVLLLNFSHLHHYFILHICPSFHSPVHSAHFSFSSRYSSRGPISSLLQL